MDAVSYTPTQRRILRTMLLNEFAAFTGEGSRRNGFGIFPAKAGGSIICCYGTPEAFLKMRGLIEVCERDAPGCWWRLTAAGKVAASGMQRTKP